MVEEDGDDIGSGRLQSSSAAEELARAGASRSMSDAYLAEQLKLARLQSQNLIEQNAFELSHLRWRRFNDQMKGALQIMLVLLGAAIVTGIGVAIWNASRSDGLVVDSFAVPPAYAQSGMTGDVMADDMMQKMAAIHDFVSGYSLAHSKDVREARQDVKVEIPETGISISEAWRYLRLWFGNEQHLNGNLRALPDGKVALTVSLGGSDTFTFAGKPEELDGLEQKAAERIFSVVDPINYVLYLDGMNRGDESLAAAARILSLWTDNRDIAEAYALYGDMTHTINGDVRLALARAKTAEALYPTSTPPHMELFSASRDLGHDEDVLEQAREIAGLRQEDNVASWRTGTGFPFVQQMGLTGRATQTGDFASLSVLPCLVFCSPATIALPHAEGFARMHDAARASELIAEVQTSDAQGAEDLARTQYYIHSATAEWRAAAADARRLADAFLSDKSNAARLQKLRVQNRVTPLLAHALAASGDFAAAQKVIDGTPLDCYSCLRERGNVDAFEKDWRGADYWFARAVNAAPSIPFAYADWGAMLMTKGDFGGAIVKFSLAHDKGPHFADPLEMWGEALLVKNRSDLALAKFEEADKYAPNWGRLHLKWGEALFYAGHKGGAQKQFAIAAGLDLSQADKDALAKWMTPHG